MEKEKAELGAYSKYLRSVLSGILSKTIAEILLTRPSDPILHLALALRRHGTKQHQRKTATAQQDNLKKRTERKMTGMDSLENKHSAVTLEPSNQSVHDECISLFLDIGDLFDDDDIK
ncbi:hypothetical protein ScPMuIL_008304 [Solemya velum]